MRCCLDIVYGPGGDDYGRDNMLEGWECPQCHEISNFTRRNIRMGIDICGKCGWESERSIMIRDMLINHFGCKNE